MDRRLWFVLALCFAAAPGRAGDHIADAYVAGSYVSGPGSTIRLAGWHVAGAITAGQKHRALSFVADVSAHFWGTETEGEEEADLTQLTVMLGPRWTFRGRSKQQVFVQLSPIGAVYRTDGLAGHSTSTGAFAVGVGIELPFWKEMMLGPRIQVDWIRPWFAAERDNISHSWRVSVGFVYRHHPAHETVRRPVDPR